MLTLCAAQRPVIGGKADHGADLSVCPLMIREPVRGSCRSDLRCSISHKMSIWIMMVLSSPASSTRRNAGNEAVKVLKTHLPKVINELLCEPTVDDVLNHMHRDLREIGVEDFGVFRFTYEGLPLEKWLLGARVEKGKLARHVYKGELQASPVFRHCNEALEPFFWYDTPHEPYDD